MSGHTPGPWSQGDRLHYEDVTGPQGDLGRPLIARAIYSNGNDPDEQKANARLIAAAPELLDACQRLIKMMDEGLLVRDIRGDTEPGWAVKQLPLVMSVKAATEAIAKATGGDS